MLVAFDVEKGRVVSVTPFPNTYLRMFCWTNETTILIGVGNSTRQGCEFCLLNVLDGLPVTKTDVRSLPDKNLFSVSSSKDSKWIAYEAHNPASQTDGPVVLPTRGSGTDPHPPKLIVAALRSGVRPCSLSLPAAWCLVSRGTDTSSTGVLLWATSVSRSSVRSLTRGTDRMSNAL